jgi:hypothetical protein
VEWSHPLDCSGLVTVDVARTLPALPIRPVHTVHMVYVRSDGVLLTLWHDANGKRQETTYCYGYVWSVGCSR